MTKKIVLKGAGEVYATMRREKGVRGEIFSSAAQLPLLIHQVFTT
jgi:hypothetical protein